MCRAVKSIFTAREIELLDMLTLGMRNRQIASRYGTSEQYIKNQMRRIFDKAGMSSRLEVALWWHAKRTAHARNPSPTA